MESNPDQGQHGQAGNLAHRDDLSELLQLAQTLVESANETYEAESFPKCDDGGICLREICYVEKGRNFSSMNINVYGPKDQESEYHPLLVTLGFIENTGELYLYDELDDTPPSKEKINQAIHACTELLLTGTLNELESAIALRTNAFLNAQLHEKEDTVTMVELSDGRRLNCAVAVGRAVASTFADFLVTKVYEDDIENAALTVTAYDKTDPEIYEEYFGTTIELWNEDADEYVRLCISENGTASITDIEEDEELEDRPDIYRHPEISQVQKIRAAVETARQRFQEYEPVRDWRECIDEVVDLITQADKLPSDAPEDMRAELKNRIDAAKHDLKVGFENAYGLNRKLSDRIIIQGRILETDSEGKLILLPSDWVALEYNGMKVIEFGSKKSSDIRNVVVVTGIRYDEYGQEHYMGWPLLPDSEIIKPDNN